MVWWSVAGFSALRQIAQKTCFLFMSTGLAVKHVDVSIRGTWGRKLGKFSPIKNVKIPTNCVYQLLFFYISCKSLHSHLTSMLPPVYFQSIREIDFQMINFHQVLALWHTGTYSRWNLLAANINLLNRFENFTLFMLARTQRHAAQRQTNWIGTCPGSPLLGIN